MKTLIAYDGSESADNAIAHLHCRRCDSENRRLIKFKSPDNQTYYLCGACVEQEDKREVRFTPSWKRSRRPPGKLAVAAL
jgi:hypothetical protein